ncbi:P-loop containing nucleoside triphosphate hydrolase protein [Mycena capillaripes]|nr:P-loop containing nucleoside triphosphate hydrolase protein [Mycena capillaripes]
MSKYRRKTRPTTPAWASAPAQPLSGWGDDNWSNGGNFNDSWGNNGASWGAPPTKLQPPRPCACTYMAPNSMQLKDVGENAQPSEPSVSTTEEDAIVERKEHYLIREQIWFEGAQRWFPYDSSRYKIVMPELDLGNYFYVNLRHLMPGDEGDLVLSNFSETLLKFLRTFYGDEFYSDSPERSTDTMLPDIPILESKIEDIGFHLRAEATDANIADKRAFAASLGCQEARNALHPESLVDQFLSESREHLSVLTNYLLELYKPKAAKLALQLADGCIEFDLLIFYFELGKQYCMYPDNINMASGFCLDGRIYDKANMTVHLTGNAYSWNGISYLETPVSCAISFYHGTRDLDSLPCQPLTPEMEAQLIARGRLYTALSGIHYRSCHNDRIIVDGIGHADPHSHIRPLAQEVPNFPEEDLWLLPSRVHGFNLTKKMWSIFYVTEIEPVSFDHNAWDHLVLDPETKVLIKSLVQVTRNSNSFASKTISDVITGKGGGLICVLHGPPGTGKTLTAEAVAEHLKRPIYVVGTSELSTKPSELEAKLKSILEIATAWDAVLLIDEADVLLEQRSLHEIERNSLVSVVLRVLEYHRGVLFLTTNRVKVFDAAFLSRFSIAIKYPEHDLHSRRVIWRKFFELAGVKTKDADGSGRSTPTDMVLLEDPAKVATMSDAELDELAEKPFNGRTIKNLVRTAQALALASDEPMSKAHVDIVVRSQEKFLREFANVSGVE